MTNILLTDLSPQPVKSKILLHEKIIGTTLILLSMFSVVYNSLLVRYEPNPDNLCVPADPHKVGQGYPIQCNISYPT